MLIFNFIEFDPFSKASITLEIVFIVSVIIISGLQLNIFFPCLYMCEPYICKLIVLNLPNFVSWWRLETTTLNLNCTQFYYLLLFTFSEISGKVICPFISPSFINFPLSKKRCHLYFDLSTKLFYFIPCFQKI